MCFRFLLVLFLVGCVLAAQSPAYKACMDAATTQYAMNKCADEEARRADAELDRVYRELLARAADHAGARDKIGAAQRAWIAFRDAQIEAMFPAEDKQANYGSMYPLCVLRVRTELTRQRTAMLKSMMSNNGCGEAY